jgi:hypothetical protein
MVGTTPTLLDDLNFNLKDGRLAGFGWSNANFEYSIYFTVQSNLASKIFGLQVFSPSLDNYTGTAEDAVDSVIAAVNNWLAVNNI